MIPICTAGRQAGLPLGLRRRGPGRLRPAACFCTALELRMLCAFFLNKEDVTETICSPNIHYLARLRGCWGPSAVRPAPGSKEGSDPKWHKQAR